MKEERAVPRKGVALYLWEDEDSGRAGTHGSAEKTTPLNPPKRKTVLGGDKRNTPLLSPRKQGEIRKGRTHRPALERIR